MDEEFIVNTIKSVYNKKPKILYSIKRNNRKVNTNYTPKISNYLSDIKNLKDEISPEINKPTKNENTNSPYNLKTLPNPKNVAIKRFSFNNYKMSHSFQKYKSKIKTVPLINKTETVKDLELKEKRQDLIKKNKNVYLLRKLYVILPNDKNKTIKNFESSKLQMYFYYPTDIKSKRVFDYIESARKSDIICNNLKDIFLEVYKYLKLYQTDFLKLEIYDGKLHPIKLDSQLFLNKIRIIYVKISYINEKQIQAWKERLKSRSYISSYIYFNKSIPEKIKLNYIYTNESTEPEKFKMNNKRKTIEIKKKGNDSNFNSNENDYSIKYNTINQANGENKEKNHKQNLILSYDKKNLSLTKKSNKTLETSYLKTLDKTSNLFTDLQNEEKINLKESVLGNNKYKIKKNFFRDLFKKNGIEKNQLLSPFLFNFDVTDIINNKYALQYLINKNKQKMQDEKYKIRNQFEIKTLNFEESNSKRENKKNNIIPNMKKNSIDKDRNSLIKANLIFEKNKKLLYELNSKINDFIDNDIDTLMSNEEIEDFKYLSCNYVLINELKEFPLLKIKKKFSFLVYLSQKLSSKYENIFNNTNYFPDFLNNILKLAEFEEALNYLNSIYNNIIKRKNYLLGYLRASNIDLQISFYFFLLFIFYNKNLYDKNPNNKLINISLECIDIKINSEINFQQYCDYLLLLTRNDYLNYNKKYNFIKDLILRIFMNENFNTKKSLKELKKLNNDININKVMNILNSDMISVKLEENIDTYNNINEIYNGYLNLVEH